MPTDATALAIRQSTKWSGLEFATVLVVQIATMRMVLADLGAASLGLWSLLISTIQVARLLDPNAAAGSARLLALAAEARDKARIEAVLSAVFVSTVPFYLALIGLAYGPLWYGIPHLVSPASVVAARQLLPFAAASLLLQMVTGGYSASLLGLGFGAWKSRFAVSGILLQLVSTWLLIGAWGIRGVGLAQTANYGLALLCSILFLRWRVRLSWAALSGCRRGALRELVGLGARMQLTSIGWTAYEMSVRICMTRWGGLEQTGLFEAAYKMATQTRVLAAYLIQPQIAVLTGATRDSRRFLAVHARLFARYSALGFAGAVALMLASPLLAWFVLGAMSLRFEGYLLAVGIASAAHVTAMPAELAGVAIGKLRCNVASTALTLCVMLAFGNLLGHGLGGPGVALAVVLASLAGALAAILCNGLALGLPWCPNWRQDVRFGDLLAGRQP